MSHTSNSSGLSRRAFLKKASVGTAAASATWLLANHSNLASASIPTTGRSWGMLIDLTRCTGCQSCVFACMEANGRPVCTEPPTGLSCNNYSYLDERDVVDEAGNAFTQAVKRQCMHCLHPACASACTVGALKKTPEGPVVYDASKCIGCRYCQYACPFGVPAYDWNNPLGLIHKCQMCVDRLEEGQKPACVAACPNGVIRFGWRDKLLAEAHAQIESNPGRYVDHVYGEHEAGGTSVLYLSAVPFADLGFPELASQPIPYYAEATMTKTPFIALTVASVISGLHWLLNRHNEQVEGIEQHTSENEEA